MVVEQILDSLRTGEFKLGEKLPSQKDLADMFGVGRSSVREAIKALDAMKYLDVIQGKGTFFKKDFPSDDQSLTDLKNALDSVAFSDLMKARVILECNAVELAAASVDPNHIHGLQEAVKKLQESEEDREKFIRIDLAFHLALAEATNNIVIYEMMKLLLDFQPCQECNTMMAELSSPEILFADEKTRADESAKFLRHLTYNHNEVVQAVMEDLPKQKRDQEPDFYK